MSKFTLENFESYQTFLNESDLSLVNSPMLIETDPKKIYEIQKLKEELIPLIKNTLKDSYNRDLVELIFSHPYVKIKALEQNGIAKRQTASAYLQKLAKANILRPIKVGKEYYYINHRLMKIISENEDLKQAEVT
jgi:Fic family protein